MAVTLASLRTAHPEFTDTPDAVVTAAITSAELRISEDELEDLYDEAVTWLACDFIACSPYSRDKRSSLMDTISSGRVTYYKSQYLDIVEAVGRMERVSP